MLLFCGSLVTHLREGGLLFGGSEHVSIRISGVIRDRDGMCWTYDGIHVFVLREKSSRLALGAGTRRWVDG